MNVFTPFGYLFAETIVKEEKKRVIQEVMHDDLNSESLT